MISIRGIAILCLSAGPLSAQQINVTVTEPQVPGEVVQAQTCPAFDSLVPGKHKSKSRIFRSVGTGDSVALTSEPFTSSDAEKWAFHYLWVAATLPAVPLGRLPDKVQTVLYAWSAPIVTDATPPDLHFTIKLAKGASLDLGQLMVDPAHRQVRFADPTKYPKQGQVVYSWTTGDALLQLVQDRKPRAALPEGGFILSEDQRGGILKVLMGAVCGVQ